MLLSGLTSKNELNDNGAPKSLKIIAASAFTLLHQCGETINPVSLNHSVTSCPGMKALHNWKLILYHSHATDIFFVVVTSGHGWVIDSLLLFGCLQIHSCPPTYDKTSTRMILRMPPALSHLKESKCFGSHQETCASIPISLVQRIGTYTSVSNSYIFCVDKSKHKCFSIAKKCFASHNIDSV